MTADEKTMQAVVKFILGTYSGEVTVECDENEDEKFIIARAKKEVIRIAGFLPLGYEKWKIIERNHGMRRNFTNIEDL